jgi:Toxin co-regulated pilus biosynthesis protein Q
MKGLNLGVVSFATTNEFRRIIKAIVPPGWSGMATREVSVTLEMKFASVDGESWVDALNRALVQSNYYAEIDWEKKQVMVKADPPTSIASSELVWVAPQLKRDKEANFVWAVLPREKQLSDVLKRWGAAAGYDVRWATSEAVTVGGAGTIKAPDFIGAMTQMIKDANSAGYQVKAQVFSNKVVRIIDKGNKDEK